MQSIMRQLLTNSEQIQSSLRKYAQKYYFNNNIATRSILTSSKSYLIKDSKLNQVSPINKRRAALFSSQSDLSLQERGIYDENNLLKFKTLHELQTNASIAFADNPLFGKYVKNEGEDAKFEYMSYSEYGDSVDTCRALLTNLGKLQTSYVCFSIFVPSLC